MIDFFDEGYGWSEFGDPLELRIPTTEPISWEMFNVGGYLYRYPCIALKNITIELELDPASKAHIAQNDNKLWVEAEYQSAYKRGIGTQWVRVNKEPHTFSDGQLTYTIYKDGIISEIEGTALDVSTSNSFVLDNIPIDYKSKMLIKDTVIDQQFEFTIIPTQGYQYTIDEVPIEMRNGFTYLVQLYYNNELYNVKEHQIEAEYDCYFIKGVDYKQDGKEISWLGNAPKDGSVFYITYAYWTYEAKTFVVDMESDTQIISLGFPHFNFIWMSLYSSFGGQVQIPYLGIKVLDYDPDLYASENYGIEFRLLTETQKAEFYSQHLLDSKYLGIPLVEDELYEDAYKVQSFLEKITIKGWESWLPIITIGMLVVDAFFIAQSISGMGGEDVTLSSLVASGL